MMKYICTKTDCGKHEIFTFPKSVNHDAMAESLKGIKNQTHGNWERIMRMPISAGFVSSKGICFGESITLGLESRGDEDAALLIEQFN